MVRFPVKAQVRSNANGTPKPETPSLSIEIFDNFGYLASLGAGSLELPGDMLDTGNHIASMLNDAYEQGRRDAQCSMREAMGIEQ